MRTGFLTLTLVLATGSVAVAGTRIDETKPASADGVVSIENLIGTVTVEGWKKNEVKVTGTLGEGPERLDFEVRGNRTVIEVVWPDDDHYGKHDEPTELVVMLPLASRVEVTGVNTGIDVTNVTGQVETETVNGSVSVSGGPEAVYVETVNGTIDVEAEAAEIECEAVNGTIRIKGARGEVAAETVNGGITVEGGDIDEAEFSSVSGDIDFEGNLQGKASLDIESHSGTVTLRLPSDISAEWDIETFSGSIHNEFGPAAQRTSEYGPGYELSFRTGSGDADISVESFSGAVHLKKMGGKRDDRRR